MMLSRSPNANGPLQMVEPPGRPDGTLVPDVKIGAWQMPWNAKPDAGHLAPGVPPSNFWASDPNGIYQIGCVCTAQGFESDYVGVIFSRGLRCDPTAQDWIGDSGASQEMVNE